MPISNHLSEIPPITYEAPKKIGPQTAALLLREFGNLENIISNAEKIKNRSVGSSAKRNADRLRTNYKLIKLGSTVPLPFSFEELAYQFDGTITVEVLQGIGIK